MKEELIKIYAWAKAKIDAGQEPPWAWYQYMKLIETIDALLAGMSSTVTVDSPLSEPLPERHLRPVDSSSPQDTSRRRPVGLPTQLPM
jgi:hypothetical protein